MTTVIAIAGVVLGGLSLGWNVVSYQLGRQAKMRPHVLGTLAVDRPQQKGRKATVIFVNTGEGHAHQVFFLLVDVDKWVQGAVNDGHLQPGEQWRVDLPFVPQMRQPRYVWACKDSTGGIYAWSFDDRHKKYGSDAPHMELGRIYADLYNEQPPRERPQELFLT